MKQLMYKKKDAFKETGMDSISTNRCAKITNTYLEVSFICVACNDMIIRLPIVYYCGRFRA